MKRDMDLIRELLLKLEALPLRLGELMSFAPDDPMIAVPGYDATQINYHLTLIREAGFVDDGGFKPMYGMGFRGLTWAGHDFLDAVRDPEIWARTKKSAEHVKGFTIDLLRDLAKGFLKKQLEEYTGVKL